MTRLRPAPLLAALFLLLAPLAAAAPECPPLEPVTSVECDHDLTYFGDEACRSAAHLADILGGKAQRTCERVLG